MATFAVSRRRDRSCGPGALARPLRCRVPAPTHPKAGNLKTGQILIVLGLALAASLASPGAALAQTAAAAPGSSFSLTLGGAEGGARLDVAVEIVLLMTLISLAPALLVLLTSFTRIIIVLGFLRQALGTGQMPANQILIGLALFLTFVIMAPVGTQIHQEALKPYLAEEIGQGEALKRAEVPLKEFMLGQTREKDIALFLELTNSEAPEQPEDLPLLVVVPSFVISELKTAFQIGFVLFLPFLIIDMVVASVLMSMGMMMLPPVLISLPFKILLFVLVDGWYLIVRSLVMGFQN
ncbi:MAG: flagellar type III secretion system pore protein FliP [bacterium]|nr:flagellar type III secretion system pore protein FliP [bacterium]